MYLSEDLLQSVKLRSMAPTSQNTFNDEKFLLIANEEMQTKLVSDLVSIREDFFQTTEKVQLKVGVKSYAIPSRAIGDSFKVLFRENASGDQVKMIRVDVEHINEFKDSERHFYLEGDEVILLAAPSTVNESLVFKFPARPNNLCLSSDVGKIQSKSEALGVASFIVDTDLTSKITVGSFVDFIAATSPFKLWAYRCQVLQITSTQIDVDTSKVALEDGSVGPEVGDFIAISGRSNIPQIPTNWHPVLAQMTVVRVLQALGDSAKLQAAKMELDELRREALKVSKNRVENSPKKVKNVSGLARFLR